MVKESKNKVKINDDTKNKDIKINKLEQKLSELKDEVNELKVTNSVLTMELKEVSKKNPRNAGRKPLINDEDKAEMVILYSEGVSQQELATKYGISIHTVKKAITDMRNKARKNINAKKQIEKNS